MGKQRFTEEFKRDAVDQIMVRGYAIAEVSRRLGVSKYSLYAWLKNPLSDRAQSDHRQSSLLKIAWEDSGEVYRYP